MRRLAYPVLIGLALAAGLLIGWMDSRQGWDDTGISAGAVILATGLLGLAAPRRAWLWALLVGIWIPVRGVADGNWGSLLALGIAAVGAYGGVLARRLLAPQSRPGP